MEKTDTPKIRGISFSKLDLFPIPVAAFLADDIKFFYKFSLNKISTENLTQKLVFVFWFT